MPILPPGIHPAGPFAGALPPAAFDNLIGWAGINTMWLKSHACPCVGDTGSPNPRCIVCLGRGTYWDPAQGPFITLITFVTWIGRNVDIGVSVDATYGHVIEGTPIITIPITASQTLWEQASMNDVYYEVGTTMRFNAVLRVDQNMAVPHFESLTIAPSGAVVVEDPVTRQPVHGAAYTVSGSIVTLNNSAYTEGTAYTVEYEAAPLYVAFGHFGGLPHIRPFGQGLNYPRRFKLQMLDLWLRNNLGSTTSIP